MAITGKFAADFASFYDAVQKAEVSLSSMESGGAKVEAQINKVANALEGGKVVQQATIAAAAVEQIGGVSKLTESELAKLSVTATEAADKLRAMGQEVPAGIQKIVDATHGAKSAWGDFTQNLNIKEALENPLGTAREAVGAFGESLGAMGVWAVGAVAGIAAVGAAIFELASHAAELGGNLNDMSEKTGLSVPALSRLSYAAQVAGSDLGQLTQALFMLQRNIGEDSPKVEQGLGKIGLSLEQLKAAGVDNYLTLISEGFKNTADPAARAAAAIELFNKPGRDMIPILMKLDDALRETNGIQAWTAQQAAEAEHFEMQMKALLVQAEAFGMGIGRDLIGPVATFVSGLTGATAAVANFLGGFGGILSPIGAAREAFASLGAAVDVFRGKTSELPPVQGEATKGIQALDAATKLHVPTLKDAFAAEQEVIGATKEWAVESKKQADALAVLSGALEGWQTTLDTVDGSVAEAIKLYLSAGVAQGTLATAYGLTERQVKAVAIALEEESAAMVNNADFAVTAGKRRVEITQAMTKATNDQILKDFELSQAEDKIAKDFLATALAEAQAQDVLQQSFAKTPAAVAPASTAVAQFSGTLVLGIKTLDEFNTAVSKMYLVLAQRGPIGDLSGPSGPGSFAGPSGIFSSPLTARASGGPVSAGQPYMVGEQGPELFVPSSSGGIVPNGGGGSTTINLVVDGRVLASIVNQHNSRDLLQGRLIQ